MAVSEDSKIAQATQVEPDFIIGYPLKVEMHDFRACCYVNIPNSRIKFKEKDGANHFGWVVLKGVSNKFTIPSSNELWKSVIKITAPNPGIENISDYQLLGSLEEHPTVAGINAVIEDDDAPQAEKDKAKKTLKKAVSRAFMEYQTRLSHSPIFIQAEYPKGKYRDYFLKSEAAHDFKYDNLKNEIASLKKSISISNFTSRFKSAKEGISSYGNIKMGEKEVSFVDDYGNKVTKNTPIVSWGGVRKVELPFTSPADFNLSKKSFNTLADKGASTLIKPIRMWVDSLGDVEEYAVGMIVGIWKMTNIFSGK